MRCRWRKEIEYENVIAQRSVEDTTLSTEFKFDLEGEIAKIKSTPANPANVANLKDSEEANSQNSQDSQPASRQSNIST